MNQYHFNKIKRLKDWEADLRAVLVFKNDVLDKETERELSKQMELLTYAIKQAERVQELEDELIVQKECFEELQNNHIRVCNQNKRYREVIEDIKNTWNVTNTYQEYMDAIHDIIADLEESK